jgi:hypothetical protein
MFVIPEYNELYRQDSVKYAPYDYYGPNNIIILDSLEKIYYHDNWTNCGTGWKVTNPPRPIDFKKYPMEIYTNINDLIENIKQTDKLIKQVILVSNTDTITNEKYFEIKSAIQHNENMNVIATRKITNDEIYAIQYNYVIENESEKPIDNKR